MAVEARNLNLFQSQLIQDRDLVVNPRNQGTAGTAYSEQMRSGNPFIQTLPPGTNSSSLYQPDSEVVVSGLTYNIPSAAHPTRKRSRESLNQLYGASSYIPNFPSLVGQDMFPQIPQYQLDIDTILSQHTKKIKLELEERQKQQARLLVTAFGEGVMKKMKEKEEQIQRMGKLNLALQERVKSLYVENQIWRDMAQTNEAAANSLRTNLQQVLQQANVGGEEEEEEDVQSCCGSSDYAKEEEDDDDNRRGSWRCRKCGERESCVLLLPCRHLCLCNVCGSGSQQLQLCPVCRSTMTATLHVNMSSS